MDQAKMPTRIARCAAILLAVLAGAASAQPPGLVACVTGTDHGTQRISVIDPVDGATRAVGPGRGDSAPRWSPDGRYLAFETDHDGGRHIRVAAADTGEGRFVSGRFAFNKKPRWSPDGTRLTYAANDDNGFATVAVVCDLESGTETVWGGATGPETADRFIGINAPVFMPRLRLPRQAGEGFATSYALLLSIDPSRELRREGVDIPTLLEEAEGAGALIAVGVMPGTGGLSTEILFVTETQRIPVIPLVPGQVQSFRYTEWQVEPDRDGASLAYESNDGGSREVFVLGRRGIADVSNHRAADWNPQWDGRGRWLLIESFRSGRRGVYTVFPNTARVDPVIVSDDADNWGGVWAPDDRWIAFVSDRTGSAQVYIATREGEQVRRISDGEGFAYGPVWQPRSGE